MNIKNKSSKEDIELLIDNHPTPMAMSDINGKILAINDKFAAILGESKEKLIGKSGFDYIGKHVIKNRKNAIIKVLKTKKPYKFEDYDKNRWWSTEIKPVIDNKGNVVKIATYIKDISEEKKSKDFIEYLSDQSLMGIGIIQENEIVYVNDAVAMITGYKKKEFIEKGVNLIIDIIHPDDKEFVLNQLKKKLLGDTDVINRYKFRFISKSGEIKWLELYSKTIVLEGKFADLINIVDITYEKIIEDNLKETQLKWDSLVKNLPETDRIIIVDREFKIIYVNRVYQNRNIEDVIGKKIDDLIPKESISDMKKVIGKVIEEGISKKFDSYALSPDGKKLYYNSIATPLIKENKIIAVLCIAIDNTNLKLAEKEAKFSTSYLKNILNSATEIIFTINPENKILLWNKSAENKTGYKQNNIINKSFKKIELFENNDEIENYIKNKINGKKPILKEIMINTKFGYKMILGVSSTEIRNELNKITDILFVCWDITHDKVISRKLQTGKSYILFDENVDKSVRIFDNYFNEIQRGLIISRDIEYILRKIKNYKKIDTFNLSSIAEEKTNNISDINTFKNFLKNYIKNNKKSIILVDRIDYLISISSFEDLIQSLYEINDYIIKYKSILLVRINSSILDYNQRISIEQEFNKIPYKIIEDLKLEENQYNILNYIKNQNQNKLIVTFQQLGKEFNISKITAKKRIESLINNDLIYLKKIGRSKALFISEKGKNIIN